MSKTVGEEIHAEVLEDAELGIESTVVQEAIDRIREEHPDYFWSVEREGRYDQVQRAVLSGGGTGLEANVISGAEKVVDILEQRDVPRDRKFMRASDWDGVIKTLEGEGMYPGIEIARDTTHNAGDEAREAVITARGPHYTQDQIYGELGWEPEFVYLAPENGNVIIETESRNTPADEDEIYVRGETGYIPREFSTLISGPLEDFQRVMRRTAARNNLKLVTGKSLSSGQLTLSIEEVEKTGLRSDGPYGDHAFDADSLELMLEDLAKMLNYEHPEVRRIDDVDELARSWFDHYNPVARKDDSFVYPDTAAANSLINEALGVDTPFAEVRYDTVPGKENLIQLEKDLETDPDVDIQDAAEYVDRAMDMTEIITGMELEKDVHDDGWINVYIPEDSGMNVKEIAAQEIASRNRYVDRADEMFIFHMDDLGSGAVESENTLFFPKYGHEGHMYAQEEGIDYVVANNFTDYYLTVSEAMHRYQEDSEPGHDQG